MKKQFPLYAIIAASMFINCSSSKKSESTGVWVNKEKIQGKSFHNIFIVVVTADIQVRVQVENELAAGAVSRGYQAVKSIDLLPASLSDPKAPTKDEVVEKVKASGCDGVVVTSLLRKEEDVHYTPGKTTYAIQPYYTFYPGYYSQMAPSVSTPGYFTDEKNYFMQTNFYDAASQEIMWSAQSGVFDPSSLQRFCKSYTTNLLKQLEKEKLLKK